MQALVDDMNAKVAEIKLGMFMDPAYFSAHGNFTLTSWPSCGGTWENMNHGQPCSESFDYTLSDISFVTLTAYFYFLRRWTGCQRKTFEPRQVVAQRPVCLHASMQLVFAL
jgi:hypothetical protein